MSARRHSRVKCRWTPAEDAKLGEAIEQFGPRDWKVIATKVGSRDPRQCRERYNNYFDPNLQARQWTVEEDLLLEQKFTEYGPRWAAMTAFFPTHSRDNIKAHWFSKKRQNSQSARNINPALSSASDPVAADQPAQEG
jgi:hypothetical protein